MNYLRITLIVLTCRNISPSNTWLSYVKKSLRYGSSCSSFSLCIATEKRMCLEHYGMVLQKVYISKSKYILNWSWLLYLPLPWKYVFVRKKATANLRMESLSSLDRILDSKGSNDAKWSNSPFNRNLCRFEGLLLVSLFGSFGGGRKL